MISKGFFPRKHKKCFWKKNLRNTLCVSFMFPVDRFFVFLKIYLWETCFLCFKQRKKHLSYFKKVNFEKNKKFIYGKSERNEVFTLPHIFRTDSKQSEQIFSSHFTCVNVLGVRTESHRVRVNLLGLWAVRTDSPSSNPLARTRTEISPSSDRP